MICARPLNRNLLSVVSCMSDTTPYRYNLVETFIIRLIKNLNRYEYTKTISSIKHKIVKLENYPKKILKLKEQTNNKL